MTRARKPLVRVEFETYQHSVEQWAKACAIDPEPMAWAFPICMVPLDNNRVRVTLAIEQDYYALLAAEAAENYQVPAYCIIERDLDCNAISILDPYELRQAILAIPFRRIGPSLPNTFAVRWDLYKAGNILAVAATTKVLADVTLVRRSEIENDKVRLDVTVPAAIAKRIRQLRRKYSPKRLDMDDPVYSALDEAIAAEHAASSQAPYLGSHPLDDDIPF